MNLIPRNAQIVVRRVPALGGRKSNPTCATRGAATTGTPIFFRPFVPQTQGATINSGAPAGNEEEKRIRAMYQATEAHFEQQQVTSNYVMGPKRMFKPTPNYRTPLSGIVPSETYTCYRCGQKGIYALVRTILLISFLGHFIQNCPTNNDPNFDRTKVRKTTGIPRSFLKPVMPSTEAGANYLVTPDGTLVQMAPNEAEWDRLATIKSLAENLADIPSEEIPEDLKCLICSRLLNNAVSVPCCEASFCDDCLRRLFDEIEGSTLGVATLINCPKCHSNLFQESIQPHLERRAQVNKFLESRNKFALPTDLDQNLHKEDSREKAVATENTTVPVEKQLAMPIPPFPIIPPFIPTFWWASLD